MVDFILISSSLLSFIINKKNICRHEKNKFAVSIMNSLHSSHKFEGGSIQLISQFYSTSYSAGSEVGTIITTITANDVDTNPALTYNFAAGGNPLNMFTIDKFSGKITLAAPLDHEGQSQYTIEVSLSMFCIVVNKVWKPSKVSLS